MKSIGIVVCNYNKEDYVVKCVQSLLDQTIDDFDIYVVDNASTDDSVKALRDTFGNQITLLVNEENLGGSGGFNTGLREALKKDYEFLMCVDNDVYFDVKTVETLRSFLEKHEDVGMVGSRCYFMDQPDRIWSFGADIDFENYVQRDNYRNCTDADGVPDVVYCTYVPACAMMVRTKAVREVGVMPEDNFIYWDDMEWGYRFNQAGYKVVAYGEAKVWHKGGGRNGETTFNNYYLWRNRIRFFLKVLPLDKREQFAEVILNDMFRLIYSCHLKGEDNIIKSVIYALGDAVHGVTGKAADYKILDRRRTTLRVKEALGDAENVLIQFNGDYEGLGNIIKSIKENSPAIKISIAPNKQSEHKLEELRMQYSAYQIDENYKPELYERHMVMCDHIFKLSQDMPQDVYIDSWCNIVFNAEDFVYAKSFEATRELFVLSVKGLIVYGE